MNPHKVVMHVEERDGVLKVSIFEKSWSGA